VNDYADFEGEDSAMTPRIVLLPALAFAATCCSVPGRPARADSEKSPSLDDQLLETLRADPLDELDREPVAPPHGKSEPPGRPNRADELLGKDADAWKRELLRELGAAAASEDENPLLDIARQMRHVEGLIAENESGPGTQGLQGRIVARLDELIKQARSCCKKCASSQSSPKVAARQKVSQPKKKQTQGRGKPTQKAATDPVTQPGKSEPGRLTLDQMKELVKSVWGELPETQREQMLQWAGEEFLPKYELLIELYFRRLAEKRRAGE
jgi:hypothetical protein